MAANPGQGGPPGGGGGGAPQKEPPPIWELRPFVGLFADHFVQATELEGGSVANALALLNYLLQRATAFAAPAGGDAAAAALAQERRARLGLLSDAEAGVVAHVRQLLRAAHPVAAQEPQEPKDLLKVVGEWTAALARVPVGATVLCPGGWAGLTSSGAVMHVLERTGEGTFAFVTCNAGEGLEYHPSAPAAACPAHVAARAHEEQADGAGDGGGGAAGGAACTANGANNEKLLYRTSIRLDDIPRERMLDGAFWSLLFACWPVTISQSTFTH